MDPDNILGVDEHHVPGGHVLGGPEHDPGLAEKNNSCIRYLFDLIEPPFDI